ncbi:type II toxin-antitoxin system Phd/YefM family antitoxin [bacterium]|nr:type II toxin-antitoxin system Phd/YefM family antitoxin [bacterium]
MRRMLLSEDVVPAKEFKAKLSSWLSHVAENRRPILITLNGKPAGVLMDPRDFDVDQARADDVAALKEGLADAAAGRFVSDEELDAMLDEAVKPRRR